MASTFQTKNVSAIPLSEFPAFINARASGKEGAIYCILDGASDKSIYPMLKGSKWEYKCLYKKNVHFEGERMIDELAATAPYLLKLDPEKMSIDSILRERIGKNQMILFESSAPMEELLDHCSSMLKAMDEDGKVINFRYYDPRILRVYLPTCTDEEIYIFFGDFDTVWVEGENEDVLEFEKHQEKSVEIETEEPLKEQIEESAEIEEPEPKKKPEEDSGMGFGIMGDFFKDNN